MIVRTWHGIVPVEMAESFRQHLLRTGVAEAEATPGNLGVYIHSQPQDKYAHFFMVSYWDNMESIKGFAGPDPHVAVCYPDDQTFKLISDPIVLHHEVNNMPAGFPCL